MRGVRKALIGFAVLAVALLVFALAEGWPVHRAGLVGTYQCVYRHHGAFATDTIELKADGTYKRTDKSRAGGSKKATGRWRATNMGWSGFWGRDVWLNNVGFRDAKGKHDPHAGAAHTIPYGVDKFTVKSLFGCVRGLEMGFVWERKEAPTPIGSEGRVQSRAAAPQ